MTTRDERLKAELRLLRKQIKAQIEAFDALRDALHDTKATLLGLIKDGLRDRMRIKELEAQLAQARAGILHEDGDRLALRRRSTTIIGI